MENKKISNSLFWSFLERFGSQAVSLIISIILARLVMPEEYGIIAAANIFTSIATSFVAGGFSHALVQKKDADDKDFATMFTFNTAFSVSIYFIIYFLAPTFVSFLNESYNYDLVVRVIRILGIGIVLSSFNAFYRALITKKLMFKSLFKLTITGTVLSSIIGIFMAYKGFGVWALVAQNLLAYGINSIMFVWHVRWRPRFYFSWSRFVPMFK